MFFFPLEVITESHTQMHTCASGAEAHTVYTANKVFMMKQRYQVLWSWILMSEETAMVFAHTKNCFLKRFEAKNLAESTYNTFLCISNEHCYTDIVLVACL